MRKLFLIFLAGCGSSTPCKTMSMDALLTEAGLVRVDIYDAGSAHCDGALLAPGAGPALASKSFVGGNAIHLSLPPGKRTVVVTTFADGAGTAITGSACSQVDLGDGKSSCLSIELSEIDAGAGCNLADDQCPMGQYCNGTFCSSGCKSNSECMPQFCDPARHQCVECTSPADCAAGKLCTSSGRCADGCDADHACTGGLTCCDSFCVDTRSDPLHCNGCGMACSGGDTLCCNGECANPSTSTSHCGGCGNACSTLNGTPICGSGTCNWSCNTGFGHCASGNTGCETDTTKIDNCGGCGNVCSTANATGNSCSATGCSYTCDATHLDCLKNNGNTDGCESDKTDIASCGMCGASCDTAHSMGATCSGTTCMYTGCAAGYSDCDKSGTNANGCECATLVCCGTACQPVHMNGLGQTYYYMCAQPGTLSQGAAQAAADAWDPAAVKGTSGCGPANCVTALSATECAVWCYDKSLAGKVTKITSATCAGVCPSGSNPVMSWN